MNSSSEYIEILPWDDVLKTNIPLIDEQHKVLVVLINDLANAYLTVPIEGDSGENNLELIYARLAEYAKFHFASEEKIWIKYFSDADNYHKHVATHNNFYTEIDEIKSKQQDNNKIVEELLSYLTTWLVKHIIDNDIRMSLAIQYIESGLNMQAAIVRANSEMTEKIHSVFGGIINMYGKITARTLDLAKERAKCIEYERELTQGLSELKDTIEIKNKELNLILDSSSIGIALVKNRVFEWANRSLLKILDLDDVVGKSTILLYENEDDYVRYGVEAYDMMASDNKTWTGSARIRIKDGSIKVLRMTGKYVNALDFSEGSIWTYEDITEVTELDAELKETTENFKIMFNSSQDAIMTLAPPNWNFTNANPATLRLFGVDSIESFLKLTPADLSPEYQPNGNSTRSEAVKMIQLAMDNGSNYFEWTHKKHNGYDFPATVLLTRVELNHQAVLIATVRDDSQRKNHERELEELHYKYLSMFMNSPEPFLIVSPATGKILDLNHASEVMLNATKADILGLTPADLSPHMQPDGQESAVKMFNILGECIKNGSTKFEWLHRRLDGAEFWAEVSLSVGEISSEPMVFVAWRDISERVSNEMSLKEAKVFAEKLSHVKSEFLANMSHEIRTPMNGIIGLTDLLLNKDLSDDVRDDLDKISISSKNLLRILNDILDFSKLEADKFTIYSEPFNVKTLFLDVYDLYKPQVELKGLDYKIAIDGNIPDVVVGDSLRIQQVVSNLIGNALKFTSSGCIKINVDLMEKHNAHVSLKVSVSDTGIGISKADQDRLFNPFSQADQSISKKYGGTGLGLVISNQILKLMNSRIELSSDVGDGSVFSFVVDMPIGIEASKKESNNVSSEPGQLDKIIDKYKELFIGKRILVAEDNMINQKVITSFLKLAGFSVAIAADGVSAVEMAKAEKYDLILMDIHMPNLDGLGAAGAIREFDVYKKIPIIALSADAVLDEKEKCLEVGMDEFVSKPIVPEVLLKVLYTFLKPD